MFKENLMTALQEAVSHFNGGLDDNAAVVKAASDYDFNKDQTLRLLETYNTAKTIDFFKKADDRRQSFATAEAEKVLPALFSTDAVLKSAAPVEYTDYDFYNEPDQGYSESTEKCASSILPDEPTEFNDVSLEGATGFGVYRLNDLRKTASYFTDQKGIIGEVYDRTLQKIAQVLKPAYLDNHEYPKVEATLHMLYKDAGDHIAEELLAYVPKDVKRASDKEKRAKICTYDVENPTVFMLLKNAHQARQTWSQYAALEAQYEKEAKDYETEFNKVSSFDTDALLGHQEMNEFYTDDFMKSAKGEKEPSKKEDYSSPFSQMASSATGAGQAGLDVAGKVINPIADKAMSSVGLPKVDVAAALKKPKERAANTAAEKMRNIQRKLILEELVTTDPVLKGEDPQSVARAYQTLMQVAPDISLNREVARSILRQSVQSVAVSPFDAKSWADLESEIRKRVRQGAATSEGNVK